MKQITIIAKTKAGTEALKQHYKETKKLRITDRISFRQMGYKQILVTEDPYTIRISISNIYFQSILKEDDMIRKIDEAMKINKAKKTDYKVEVI